MRSKRDEKNQRIVITESKKKKNETRTFKKNVFGVKRMRYRKRKRRLPVKEYNRMCHKNIYLIKVAVKAHKMLLNQRIVTFADSSRSRSNVNGSVCFSFISLSLLNFAYQTTVGSMD